VAAYRADWLLPITSAPIRRGWVAVDGGRVQALGTGPCEAVDLGRRVILPSLVNAHTHLELSYLRGLVPPAPRLVDWVTAMQALRKPAVPPHLEDIETAARAAIMFARASGTGLIGDVGNVLVTVDLLRSAAMPARVFLELIGFGAHDVRARVAGARASVTAANARGGDVCVTIAPHAPYSVSPELFGAIRADLDAAGDPITTVHLGESPEEIQFLASGEGAWREFLVAVGAWNPEWTPPGRSPVQYLDDLRFLDARALVVHGVQLEGEDLSYLRMLGSTLVVCPRSNRHVGVGSPPLEAFYAMDIPVAIGTDSLASAPDLDMFAELAEARRVAPRVPARALLASATISGARALGFEGQFGAIETGVRASLIAVRVPEDVTDVEEYLVSGVAPDAVEWLDAA
jgi:cytosine/adenosine deaminase-related metal-dependent hydrolase